MSEHDYGIVQSAKEAGQRLINKPAEPSLTPPPVSPETAAKKPRLLPKVTIPVLVTAATIALWGITHRNQTNGVEALHLFRDQMIGVLADNGNVVIEDLQGHRISIPGECTGFYDTEDKQNQIVDIKGAKGTPDSVVIVPKEGDFFAITDDGISAKSIQSIDKQTVKYFGIDKDINALVDKGFDIQKHEIFRASNDVLVSFTDH